jgi:hypothetical protein
LREANGSRECAPDDKLRDEAIQDYVCSSGLLRFARNDRYRQPVLSHRTYIGLCRPNLRAAF